MMVVLLLMLSGCRERTVANDAGQKPPACANLLKIATQEPITLEWRAHSEKKIVFRDLGRIAVPEFQLSQRA